MISTIKNWWFLATVKAEILAQHKDQGFVDRICHRVTTRKFLEETRKGAHYKSAKSASFLAACGVLEQSMDAGDLSDKDQGTASALLAQRVLKIADSSFRLAHIMLVSEWEEKLIARHQKSQNSDESV